MISKILNFLKKTYVIIILFFVVWMIFFDTNSLIIHNELSNDIDKLNNQKIVLVKGCSDVDISSDLYVEITKLLLPVVKKLMFGEACSSVPIYMKKK